MVNYSRILKLHIYFLILCLCACDGQGINTPVTPAPTRNIVPTADAGADREGAIGELLPLSGKALDMDGEITSVYWAQIAGPIAAIQNPTQLNTSMVLPDVWQAENIILELKATDNQGATSSDRLVISVDPFIKIAPSATGLATRPSNQSCLAGARPAEKGAVKLTPVFRRLSGLSELVDLQQVPKDNSHWYAVTKAGKIWRFENNNSAETLTIALDWSKKVSTYAEQGLLSLAFHPNFSQNGFVFIFYQTQLNESRVARVTSRDGGKTFDPASEQIIVNFRPPNSGNHRGGRLAFDKDGYLFLSIGDGQSSNRVQENNNWLGKILRLDVNSTAPYAIPQGNPFANNPLCTDGGQNASYQCPEIYAWGFRNPWRWSFDRTTGDLWLGDVGESTWEEINLIKAGSNYGWPILEGNDCWPGTTCNPNQFAKPIWAYLHKSAPTDSGSASVTGGYVYRGKALPELAGRYIFGDYVRGTVSVLINNELGEPAAQPLANVGSYLSSFAEDADGELYALGYSGAIFRLEANVASAVEAPEKLSQTGCFDADNPSVPARGLIPYTIKIPFWSDGADKKRWFALPDNTTLVADPQNLDKWLWPIGSVLIKEFTLAGRTIETRLLKRHNDGSWKGYSYVWNQEQTEAYYVPEGTTQLLEANTNQSVNWIYPSSYSCNQCHNAAAGFVLGFTSGQLNTHYNYSSTHTAANQLVTLSAINIFATIEKTLPVATADDANYSLNRRARSYLQANCAHCHQGQNSVYGDFDLRLATPLARTHLCEIAELGLPGMASLNFITPGRAEQSAIWLRMQRRDNYAMPPLGSTQADEKGAQLIAQWINQLRNCYTD